MYWALFTHFHPRRLLRYCSWAMFGLLLLLVLAIALALAAARWYPLNDIPQATPCESLLITNVNLLDVKQGKVRTDQQILIEQGRIQNIQNMQQGKLTAEKVVNGQNGYLLPGLIDMHVHIHDPTDLLANLAAGVTTVRNLSGMPKHLRWRTRIEQGQWLTANLLTTSPILGNQHAWLFHQVVNNPEHGRALIKHFAKQGYDGVKVYGYLSDDNFSALIEQAKQQGVAIAKHGPHAGPDLPISLLKGMQSVEHVEDVFQGPLDYQFDASLLPGYLAQLAESGVFFTPTLATFAHLTQLSTDKQAFVDSLQLDSLNPFYRQLNRLTAVERWLAASDKHADWNRRELAFLQKITLAAHQAKIPLLVGSDAGTMYMTGGYSTHQEMQLMQQAGIAAAEVIKAATWHAALALKQPQRGSIEVGYQADLLLVTNNPLQNVQHLQQPLAVVKNGQWLDESTLHQLTQASQRPASYLLGLAWALEDFLVRTWNRWFI